MKTTVDIKKRQLIDSVRGEVLKKIERNYYLNLVRSCELKWETKENKDKAGQPEQTIVLYDVPLKITLNKHIVVQDDQYNKYECPEYSLSFVVEKTKYTMKGMLPEHFFLALYKEIESVDSDLFDDMKGIIDLLHKAPLSMCADDCMPWGAYKGKTIREIYKLDIRYFKFLCNSAEYKISESTVNIIKNHSKEIEKSRLFFSTGGKLNRTEYFPEDVIWLFENQEYTLEQVFMENESCYRHILDYEDIFISQTTFEKLMVKKYGPNSIIHHTRQEVNAKIINTINGFEFSEDEEYTDDDLKEYIGEPIETTFSPEMSSLISSDIKEDKYGLKRILKKFYGDNAQFREGQEEAILAVLNGKKTLVVQHTGWGKSLVYFMSIKKLREMGKGPAIIISPLLALMHNQEQASDKLGLKIKAISSDNYKEWKNIYSDIKEDKLDAIIISPERLGNPDFMREIQDYLHRISLFVVDEAHCISDWGHDFRPDFRRIVGIINKLPKNTAILATTATANDRVLRDIKHQLGNDLEILRGTMERTSINIDVLELGTNSSKKAWLIRNIPKMNGSGIVYCLTIRDCEEVMDVLQQYRINAAIYHGQLDPTEKKRTEEKFQNNDIKVLVATVAFGMGIDKPDIAFVVHYQQPANAISYYQQIGRAGRGISKAYAILLAGDEDNEINEYFIKNAFPTENEMNKVINFLTLHPGCNEKEVANSLDVTSVWAKKVLKYLHVNGDLRKTHYGYYRTNKPWHCDMKRARIVSWFRWKELRKFNEFIDSKSCYMSFIRKELDDTNIEPCGRCANCLGTHFFQ